MPMPLAFAFSHIPEAPGCCGSRGLHDLHLKRHQPRTLLLVLVLVEPFPHRLNPGMTQLARRAPPRIPSCTHNRNPSTSATIVTRAAPSTPKRQYSSPPCVPS